MTTFTFLMNYKNFTDAFSKINDFPLPGLKAQLLAAPLDRRDKIISIKGLVKTSFDLSDQPNGIYFVRVFSNDSYTVKRIVKN